MTPKMELEKICIFLVVCLAGSTSLTIGKRKYVHGSGLPVDEMVPAILTEVSDTSDISCARLCNRHANCSSFTLDPGMLLVLIDFKTQHRLFLKLHKL